ncbi:hypothetical protein HDU78_010972 [Chytriomyces hyalinus]|nr:hypothetical protein HDU78_010972 [Chytriomyces hyalinus]KAJ3262728.1 hypothetical protein HDU77_000170 [Chytriomyces hyalinus]KAJ3405222.1 hypothetical protein HDU80_001677 [Chytriomyces hyalinus]
MHPERRGSRSSSIDTEEGGSLHSLRDKKGGGSSESVKGDPKTIKASLKGFLTRIMAAQGPTNQAKAPNTPITPTTPGAPQRSTSATSKYRDDVTSTATSPYQSLARSHASSSTEKATANAQDSPSISSQSQANSLRSALHSIQRDLEDIAHSQQQFINAVSMTPSASATSPYSSPVMTPIQSHSSFHNQQQRSKSISSNDSSSQKRKNWIKPSPTPGHFVSSTLVVSAPIPTGTATTSSATLTTHSDAVSIKSSRSTQSFESKRSDDDYMSRVEQQGLNALYLKAGLGGSGTSFGMSASYSGRSALSPEMVHGSAGRSSSASSSPVPPTSTVLTKKVVEDVEQAVLKTQLGEGYPDTSALLVGEGGRLLLPSEVKRLGMTHGNSSHGV